MIDLTASLKQVINLTATFYNSACECA